MESGDNSETLTHWSTELWVTYLSLVLLTVVSFFNDSETAYFETEDRWKWGDVYDLIPSDTSQLTCTFFVVTLLR